MTESTMIESQQSSELRGSDDENQIEQQEITVQEEQLSMQDKPSARHSKHQQHEENSTLLEHQEGDTENPSASSSSQYDTHLAKKPRISARWDPSKEKETDNLLPIANVARIMKLSLPENTKVANPAKDLGRAAVSEFVSFVTSEAADRCIQEKRRTITSEDIIWALSSLGFDSYSSLLKTFLRGFRLHNRGEDVRMLPESPKPQEEEEVEEEDLANHNHEQQEQGQDSEQVEAYDSRVEEDGDVEANAANGQEDEQMDVQPDALYELDPAIVATIQMALAQHQQEQYEQEQRRQQEFQEQEDHEEEEAGDENESTDIAEGKNDDGQPTGDDPTEDQQQEVQVGEEDS